MLVCIWDKGILCIKDGLRLGLKSFSRYDRISCGVVLLIMWLFYIDENRHYKKKCGDKWYIEKKFVDDFGPLSGYPVTCATSGYPFYTKCICAKTTKLDFLFRE